MAGAGFHSIANPRALNPRIATTILFPWQSAFQCSVDCQPPLSGLIQTLQAFQAFGIPLSNSDSWLWQSAARQFSLWQSAWKITRSPITGLKIWARSLAIEWNPAPAILHREASCLKHRIYLKRYFTSVKLIRGALFRSQLYINGLSWHTISWHYTFKLQGLRRDFKKTQSNKLINTVSVSVQYLLQSLHHRTHRLRVRLGNRRAHTPPPPPNCRGKFGGFWPLLPSLTRSPLLIGPPPGW
jgi:hypothetical protein